MYLTLFSGIIRWPQIGLIIGLIVAFIVVMRIPRQVKEVSQPEKKYEDATSEGTKGE